MSIGIIGEFCKPKVRLGLLIILTHHEIYNNLAGILTESLIFCSLLPFIDILGDLELSQYFIPLYIFFTSLLRKSTLFDIWRIGCEATHVVFGSY